MPLIGSWRGFIAAREYYSLPSNSGTMPTNDQHEVVIIRKLGMRLRTVEEYLLLI